MGEGRDGFNEMVKRKRKKKKKIKKKKKKRKKEKKKKDKYKPHERTPLCQCKESEQQCPAISWSRPED